MFVRSVKDGIFLFRNSDEMNNKELRKMCQKICFFAMLSEKTIIFGFVGVLFQSWNYEIRPL